MPSPSNSALNRRRLLRRSVSFVAGVAIDGVVSSAANIDGHEPPHGLITDVGGLRVGHFTDTRRPTGCTVVLFDHGAVAGVDVRGAAPGTRETDLLRPENSVQEVNALVLAGGSAFGLDSATGVMRYLEESGQGFHMGSIVVPIVPAAILFDLGIGDSKIRPDADAGFAACRAASAEHVQEGSVGAGAGATVGKLFGMRTAMKSGLGTASIRVGESEIVVGAIVAVNAVGDVFDHRTGKILAGALTPDHTGFADTIAQIASGALLDGAATRRRRTGANSTIGIVATNAAFTKTEMTKIAQMAHDGLARTINPVHTAFDGDTIFAASTRATRQKADIVTVGSLAAEAMAFAVERAVISATAFAEYPAHRDLRF